MYIKDTPIPHVVVSLGQYLDFSASTTVDGCSVTIQNTYKKRECLHFPPPSILRDFS